MSKQPPGIATSHHYAKGEVPDTGDMSGNAGLESASSGIIVHAFIAAFAPAEFACLRPP
jgi:hypothetical protein